MWFEHLDAGSYRLPESLTQDLMSPALIVYLDRVRDNVRWMLEATGGAARWRPHVKTTKIPEVWTELVRAGVHQFKCATTREAELLLTVLENEQVTGDVLIAYPLVGPSLRRVAAIAERFPGQQLAVLCEELAAVDEVPAGVAIHIDVNTGMNRTGVPLGERDRVLEIARAAGERMRGLHYYDGHLHQSDLDERRERVFGGYEELLALRARLLDAGLAVPEIVTAGTPAFLSALEYAPLRELAGTVHRVSPGTVVYHDQRSEEENPALELAPAALVFARVVSRPAADRVTCDAGSKAIAAEAGDPVAVALGRPELIADTPSEEHLPLRVTSGPAPARGSELLLVPRHVCPTINLAEEAVLIEGGQVRGIVPVAARAHETLV